MLPIEAVVVVVPVLEAVLASPFEPDALLIVAMDVLDELHVTALVISCCDPSVYDPVAVNCMEVLYGTKGFSGVTLIETSSMRVTVRVVEPEIPSCIAVTVVEPVPTEEATPLEPAALLIEATEGSDELQVTVCVRS
jgi:hypothetical protein